MTTENDFLPFAVGGSANVEPQASYAAMTSLLQNGFTSGIAPSIQLNKVWRQASIMAAVIAQFIVAQTGQTAIDDGTTATLLANFTAAVNAASKNKIVLTDTGTANAYAAANPLPLTALPTATGFTQTVKVAHTNTGASTYAPDGLATAPIYGLGGAVLQGGELPANGVATLVSFVDPLLNSGNLCWVLYECVGGSQQVALPTQSQHAAQLRQIGSVAGIITTGVSGPITSANAGRSTFVTAGGTTQTVNTATLNPGDRFYVYANYNGTSQTTLAISGSGSFISINSISQSTIVLNAGEEVIFTWDGANLGLETLSANLRYSSAFSNNQASNGFQKLPSGLILQWGSVGSIASGASTTVTFPLTFPTNCFFVGSNAASAPGVTDAKINPGSKTLSTVVLCNNGTAGPFGAEWFAIGN